LEEGPEAWQLTIHDDGIGYDRGSAPRGLGSELIEAFAHHLSGTAEWTSRPGDGTQLRMRFPAPGRL
jgi:signal transduction histidine kinase